MASGRDNKRGLGRGLSALMADVTEAEKPVQGGPAADLFVPIEQIGQQRDLLVLAFQPLSHQP